MDSPVNLAEQENDAVNKMFLKVGSVQALPDIPETVPPKADKKVNKMANFASQDKFPAFSSK